MENPSNEIDLLHLNVEFILVCLDLNASYVIMLLSQETSNSHYY